MAQVAPSAQDFIFDNSIQRCVKIPPVQYCEADPSQAKLCRCSSLIECKFDSEGLKWGVEAETRVR